MERFTYQIGGLEIDPVKIGMSEKERKFREELLRKGVKNPMYIADHRFVIHHGEGMLNIYITSYGYRHSHVVGKFGLPNNQPDLEPVIVGGGNCWIDHEGRLLLDDYSGDYGAIPKVVAQAFAELLPPDLEKLGLRIREVIASPNELELKSFWKNRGFS